MSTTTEQAISPATSQAVDLTTVMDKLAKCLLFVVVMYGLWSVTDRLGVLPVSGLAFGLTTVVILLTPLIRAPLKWAFYLLGAAFCCWIILVMYVARTAGS